jgi:hypothetical protein
MDMTITERNRVHLQWAADDLIVALDVLGSCSEGHNPVREQGEIQACLERFEVLIERAREDV